MPYVLVNQNYINYSNYDLLYEKNMYSQVII